MALTEISFLYEYEVVVLSNYFQDYYFSEIGNKKQGWSAPRRKEMLCAVAIKLIKVIFALLWDKREFVDLVPAAAA